MKKNWIAYPYTLWMIIFTIVPLFLVLFYSVVGEDKNGYYFTFQNLQRVFEPLYLIVLYRSVKLAVISTIACLLIGYPMALILAERHLSKRSILVVLFVIPMWMNFLARTYAWMTILEKNCFIGI